MNDRSFVIQKSSGLPLTSSLDTLSPSEGERDGARGNSARQLLQTAAAAGLLRSSGRSAVCCTLAMSLVLSGVFSSFAETILLTGATVHTVSGPTLGPGQVLIKDGKIAAVEKVIKAKADRVVKLDGQHLYPGLIAASTSLGLVEINAVRATRDASEVGEYTPDVQSWIAVNPDSELIPVARANGITHFLPVPSGGIVAGQSGLMSVDGWTTEDMTVKKPVALHVFWPNMELNTTPREEFKDKSKWKSLEDQAKERREKIKALEDFFEEARAYAKAREAGGKNGLPAENVVPAWEAMRPYVRGDLPLMVHADDERQIKAAVQWAATNSYKIIVTGGRDAWKLAGLLATNQVPVIFERIYNQASGLSSTPARDTYRYDVYFAAPATLHQAGVKVIFSEGLDGQAAASRFIPRRSSAWPTGSVPSKPARKQRCSPRTATFSTSAAT